MLTKLQWGEINNIYPTNPSKFSTDLQAFSTDYQGELVAVYNFLSVWVGFTIATSFYLADLWKTTYAHKYLFWNKTRVENEAGIYAGECVAGGFGRN